VCTNVGVEIIQSVCRKQYRFYGSWVAIELGKGLQVKSIIQGKEKKEHGQWQCGEAKITVLYEQYKISGKQSELHSGV